MASDPSNPYGDPGFQAPPDDDYGWWGLIDGVWRRMTDSAPYPGETS